MLLSQGERIDRTGFGNLRLIQKPEDFCYGIDAVILADFASHRKADTIMDLGTGTGIIPLILSHKTNASRIYGLEYQSESFQRAVRNVKLNHLEDRLQFLQGNVADFDGMKGEMDAVTMNPPYMKHAGGLQNDNPARTIARHEVTAALEDFIACGAGLLKERGDLYLVHRPGRLVDILSLCRAYKVEPKELRLVHPREGEPPNIVLVHCSKNGGVELKILPPLFVYDAGVNYTDEIQHIYERIT